MEKTTYPKGFYIKEPHQNAPSFVLGKLSIKKDVAINWLGEQDGDYVNLDMLKSDKGFYLKVNEWKPKKNFKQAKSKEELDNSIKPEDLPF